MRQGMGYAPEELLGTIAAGRQPPIPTQTSLTWSPLASPTALHFNGTSFDATRKALQEAFGALPIRLNRDKHLPVLLGMIIGSGGCTPYKELHAALSQFGELEIELA